jgi:NADH-quinone oxidoreductase subunit C
MKFLVRLNAYSAKFFCLNTGMLTINYCNYNKSILNTVLITMTATDSILTTCQKRFTIIYLYNIFLRKIQQKKFSIFLKKIDNTSMIFSLEKNFASAKFYEREIYDMFGVSFANNSDLRRILTDYGFSGYPLKKDFPLTGYIEITNITPIGRILYKKVILSQNFR